MDNPSSRPQRNQDLPSQNPYRCDQRIFSNNPRNWVGYSQFDFSYTGILLEWSYGPYRSKSMYYMCYQINSPADPTITNRVSSGWTDSTSVGTYLISEWNAAKCSLSVPPWANRSCVWPDKNGDEKAWTHHDPHIMRLRKAALNLTTEKDWNWMDRNLSDEERQRRKNRFTMKLHTMVAGYYSSLRKMKAMVKAQNEVLGAQFLDWEGE